MRKILIATAILGALAASPAHAQFGWGGYFGSGYPYGGWNMGTGLGFLSQGMGQGLLGGQLGGPFTPMYTPPPEYPQPVPVEVINEPPVVVQAPPVYIQPAPVRRCVAVREWDALEGWVIRRACR